MKQWEEEIEINASIDDIWKLFDGSLEDMQKIMPNIVENEPIKQTEEIVGSVHRQHFKGKREQSYDVEVLEYDNESDYRKLKVGFSLSNVAHITATYELEKMEDLKTRFRYVTTNDPLKWYIRPLLFFSGNKAVTSFVSRVKRITEQK